VVISYRRFETNHRSHPQGLEPEDETDSLSRNVRNYHYSLRNNPEERGSQYT